MPDSDAKIDFPSIESSLPARATDTTAAKSQPDAEISSGVVTPAMPVTTAPPLPSKLPPGKNNNKKRATRRVSLNSAKAIDSHLLKSTHVQPEVITTQVTTFTSTY